MNIPFDVISMREEENELEEDGDEYFIMRECNVILPVDERKKKEKNFD
jgi:hypothetical protein